MYMKKIRCLCIFAVICLFAAVLCGCNKNLKTQGQAVSYAKVRYGDCKVVAEDKINDEKIVYTMKDNDYGFEYKVTSSISSIMIDGSSFGGHESTSDDFLFNFRDYIENDSAEKFDLVRKKYNMETEDADMILKSVMYLHMKDNDMENAENAAKQTAYIFKHYEKKKVFSVYDIVVYDPNGDLMGRCMVETGKWMDKEAIKDDKIIQWAKEKNSNAKYLRKETRTFADTGVSADDVVKFHYESDVKSPQNGSDPVTYYYFEADGKEFFVCDFWTKQHDKWYTNYYDVFKKQ